MNPFRRIKNWLTPSLEDDYYALDGIAARMLGNYTDLVSVGADRRELAKVLTGVAGCCLAMSRAVEAADLDDGPEPGRPTQAESDRLEGLLLQEIAYCVAEGIEYRGVRCRELEAEPASAALRMLAVAYHGASAGHLYTPPIGQRLDELWHVAVDVIGGDAAECLVPLMIAHSYDPYACDCDGHGDRSGLPTAEQRRRAEVTRGCDQP